MVNIQQLYGWIVEPFRTRGADGEYTVLDRIDAVVGWLWSRGFFGTPHGAVCPEGLVAGYYCDWILCGRTGGLRQLTELEEALEKAAEEALKASGVDGSRASEMAREVRAYFWRQIGALDEADRLLAMGGRYRRKLNKLAR